MLRGFGSVTVLAVGSKVNAVVTGLTADVKGQTNHSHYSPQNLERVKDAGHFQARKTFKELRGLAMRRVANS